MSGYETILVERRGRVGVITLNRPEALNALNSQLMREVVAAATELDLDRGIGAIVLTHRDRVRSRHQNIEAQVTRRTQLDMARVPVGASIGELGILRPPVPEEKPKVIAHDDHGHGGGHH